MAGKEPVAGNYGSAVAQNLGDITLMLLGKTGAGKSSLGNIILKMSGEDGFQVTVGLFATSIYRAVVKKAKIHDRLVKVVDTPGVMDTNAGSGGGEEKALEGICDAVTCCPEGVDVFLIVLRLDVRFTKEESEAILKLEKLLGQEFWNHAIVVFTHGDCIGNDAKKFKDSLTAAKAQIPELQQLMSKLKTEPQLFDARQDGRPDETSKKQMIRLTLAMDLLVKNVDKKKYTNELFQAAKAELEAQRFAELQMEHQKGNLELQALMKEFDRMMKCREEDAKERDRLLAEREEEKKMVSLERQLKENGPNKMVDSPLAKPEKELEELKELKEKTDSLALQLKEIGQKLEAKRIEAAKRLAKRSKCQIM